MASNSSSQHCQASTAGFVITSVFLGSKCLVAPLSVLVLYLGLRRRPGSSSSSHSDVLTFHSAAMELVFALGAALYLCGQQAGLSSVAMAGMLPSTSVLFGQMSFHVLTCVERHLAVARPVAYMRLRESGGVRIRNLSAGCVWLLCFGWLGVIAWYYPGVAYVPYLSFLSLALGVVSFCSLSVLGVLLHPGPGERACVDRSKRRAFNTMAAITGVLWLNFLLSMATLALYSSHTLTFTGECVMLALGNFSNLPSSLVLPLLFLRKALFVSTQLTRVQKQTMAVNREADAPGTNTY